MVSLALFCLAVIFAALYIKTKIELKKLHDEISLQTSKNNFGTNFEEEDEPVDSLTELVTFPTFEKRTNLILSWSKQTKSQFAVMFLNIRHFSGINELGYEIGDQALSITAKRLKSCVRQIDTVAHYGGDKFLILLPQLLKPEMASFVAQRIQDNFLQPLAINDFELLVNVDIGIAIFPDDGQDPATLVKNAFKAATELKEQKKIGYQFYNKNINALGERQMALLELFQKNEFLPHAKIEYTPYVDITTNQVSYVHTLPQLIHPIHGLVMTPEFLKYVDKTKKTEELYDWLFRSIATQISAWKEKSFQPNKIAVDISLKNIEQKNFVNMIKKTLNELNIPPDLIVFQILESDSKVDVSTLLAAFESINQEGSHIAIDVITLGHLALKKVDKLPVEYLRIDENLTKTLIKGNEANSILNRVTTLANAAGIMVIADGVENDLEQSRLKEMGCRVMSGKLFAGYIPQFQ